MKVYEHSKHCDIVDVTLTCYNTLLTGHPGEGGQDGQPGQPGPGMFDA
jgi:hypothetical protein